MEYIPINIEAVVDISFKTSNFGRGPADEQMYVAINFEHAMCGVYYDSINSDGTKVPYHNGQYAIRVTDNGLQYYDYQWRYFCKMTQEQYSGYIAEKELLGE